MKALKKWWKNFTSPTPKKWARVSKTLFSLSGAVTAGWLVIPSLGVTLPDEWGKFVAVSVASLVAIATYAQSHAKPDTK